MDLPGGSKSKYSFPVIVGTNPGEPPSTRLARMKIYDDVIGQLDSGGGHYSQELSEVDLSDPDDVKVLADNSEGEVLIHLGSSDYLDRYKIYVSHVHEWRQQFDKLESVDFATTGRSSSIPIWEARRSRRRCRHRLPKPRWPQVSSRQLW